LENVPGYGCLPDKPFRITSRMDLKQLMLVDVGWIHLAQNRDQRRVVLNTVMNLGFHIRGGIS
jgi:hypothetical protein